MSPGVCNNQVPDRSQTIDSKCGEMSEWLKEHAWKACVGETLPRVRIPLSPPASFRCFSSVFRAKSTRREFSQPPIPFCAEMQSNPVILDAKLDQVTFSSV